MATSERADHRLLQGQEKSKREAADLVFLFTVQLLGWTYCVTAMYRQLDRHTYCDSVLRVNRKQNEA